MNLSAAEWKRKAVHAGMGLFALTLRWLDWKQAALLAACALLVNLFVMPRLGRSIYRDPSRARDAGIVAYPATVLLLVVIFRDSLSPIAAAVWAMMAFGDPAATIAGKVVGGPRLPWNRDKTWVGLLSNWAVSGICSVLVLRFVTARPLEPLPVAILIAGSFAFSVLESVDAGIDDNLVAGVPTALLVFQLAWALGEHALPAVPALPDVLAAAAINAAVALATGFLGVVSPSGAVAGALVGCTVLLAGGWRAYAILWAFFLLGTATTRWKYAQKTAAGVAQTNAGRRGTRHVIANVGVPAVLLILGVRPIAFVAALAAALADTLATEIGSLYGKRPRSPLTWRRLEVGTPGAVSLPGTVAALAGAASIGAAAALLGLVSVSAVAVVALAGLFGTFAESALTAASRARGVRLDHEFANAFNTFAGAMIALEIVLSIEKGSLYLPIES